MVLVLVLVLAGVGQQREPELLVLRSWRVIPSMVLNDKGGDVGSELPWVRLVPVHFVEVSMTYLPTALVRFRVLTCYLSIRFIGTAAGQ